MAPNMFASNMYPPAYLYCYSTPCCTWLFAITEVEFSVYEMHTVTENAIISYKEDTIVARVLYVCTVFTVIVTGVTVLNTRCHPTSKNYSIVYFSQSY